MASCVRNSSGRERAEDERCRAWVFTHYADEPPVFEKSMRYLLYAPEICPTTGRPHWQGFVVYKNARTITAIQNGRKRAKMPAFGWLKEPAGHIGHQLSYIRGPYDDGKGKTKPFNPDWKEFGKRPAQGKRNDLVALKEKIVAGETRAEDVAIADPTMYHKYGRTLHKIEDITLRKKVRKWMTKGVWIFGPTGVGKSHEAFAKYIDDWDPDKYYVWRDDKGWQDAYTGQEIVIINDFRGSIPYNELLQMVDKWPHYVRRRGREPAPFLAKQVIITSSLSPEQVYNRRNAADNIAQLLRRFKIVDMTPQSEGSPSGDRAEGEPVPRGALRLPRGPGFSIPSGLRPTGTENAARNTGGRLDSGTASSNPVDSTEFLSSPEVSRCSPRTSRDNPPCR